MKEEGFNPNAVITDQVIDALANIQDHEPGSFREHTEKLTDILLDDLEEEFCEDGECCCTDNDVDDSVKVEQA